MDKIYKKFGKIRYFAIMQVSEENGTQETVFYQRMMVYIVQENMAS